MRLSEKAKQNLKAILIKELGTERVELFSDTDLEVLGIKLLKMTAISLKRKAREPQPQLEGKVG